MMKTISLLSVCVAACFLSGCSTTTPIRVDEGPIKAGTFSFVDRGARALPEYADQRSEIHPVIQDSISAALERRGVSRVEKGGDVTVAYLVIVGDNASTTSLNDYFGYGRDATALVDKAHDAFAVRDQNPNAFEKGTLVIDVIDSTSNKLLKRNFVVRPILRDATAEVRRERIDEAVEEALKDLRIKK